MGTYGVCDVALRTRSSDKPKRAREVVETDAPRTMSSYGTERRAKQATSTASIADANGYETHNLEYQTARGSPHVPRRRSRSQYRSDAPFSSMASTNACTHSPSSGARARSCLATSAGVVRRSIAGMKQLGMESRMGRQSRYLPRTSAFRAVARGCAMNVKTLSMHAHVIG